MHFHARVSGLALVAALIFAGSLGAAEITGTVKEVSGGTATIDSQGGAPTAGDSAEFFFKLAGMDEEISVASGTVVGSEGTSVKVKIENATGEVATGHLVRFTRGKGGPPPIVAASPSAPPLSSPTSSAGTSGAPAGTGYIGVHVSAGPDGQSGAFIVAVTPESPAERGGLQPNDLIMAIDGSPVQDFTHLADATAKMAPGSRHAFLFSRAGKLEKVELTIALRPADFSPPPPTAPPEDTPDTTPTGLPPSVPFPTTSPRNETTAVPETVNNDDAVAAPFLNKGIAQYSAGNISGAIASYTRGIEAAPNVALLYLNRAGAYLYQPNFQAAITDANKAVELKVEKLDDAYTIRGTARAGLGDYDSAIADCNRAIKINPRNALAYNNRANNKLRKGDYRGALADCEKSIALSSNMALSYYNRGFARTNLGNQAGALADWKKAVQMQSSFGAELNPKIAQLEAVGVAAARPAPPPKPPAPAGAGEWTDLTNAPQKMIGTWQGGRHRTVYFADGTFVTDPHLVPDPPKGQWQVQGDRLIEFYPQANTTTTHNILSIDGKALVIRNAQGMTFRLTRIK